ncbi:MAG: tetratricopeptide repeat protein, partial [Caldilineaceae bacterium]|nr:tetratricopeptide repeat protein [Caldilineaceae bacterium]
IGTLAWYQEDYDTAQAYLKRGLTTWQALGDSADPKALAHIYLSLGGIARQHDNYRAAIAYHTSALAIQRTLANQQGMADALHNLGVAEMYLGNYTAAQSRFAECYALDCALGDQWGIFLDLNSWGVLDYLQEDFAAARKRLEKGLQLARDLGAKTRLSLLLSHLGKVALADMRRPDAKRYFQEALTVAEEVAIKSQRFAAHIGLGILAIHEQDDSGARMHLTSALTIWRADRKPKELLSLLEPLALYSARRIAHDPMAAIETGRLLGFVDAHRDQFQLPPREPIYCPLHVQSVALITGNLSADEVAAAHEQGRRRTVDEIVEQIEALTSDTFRTHPL